jgi:rhamnose utilization protein RhaD (predicted bifunctional aldolase and dehydrogenase)
VTHNEELRPLLELSARVGRDPLLTQASTGNASMKLNGCLWIKASGKWMADAMHQDILVPVDLADVRDCVRRYVEPTELYPDASIETSMHAVLPHRVVLHLHCVNTIAWAVRQDAPVQLGHLLNGLPWQWIPYVQSGLNLAHAIQTALARCADTQLLVLGNHGFVIGGDDCGAVQYLISEVQRRLAITPRHTRYPDYSALAELADRFSWDLPDDDDVHSLGTDAISRKVLGSGLLYPCQAIFSNSYKLDLFRSIPYCDIGDQTESVVRNYPFLIVEERGIIINRTMTLAERAMIGGLSQVVQRISESSPIRYLTEAEVRDSARLVTNHYLELANAGHDAGH